MINKSIKQYCWGVVLLSAGMIFPAKAETVALLVGVGQYKAFYGQKQGNLEGPAHDIKAFKDLLLNQWHLQPRAVRTLIDSEATKERILAEIDALSERSRPGDEVLIYFSGHGTGVLDDGANLPLPHGTGAWVPYDWPGPKASITSQIEGLLVGRNDLRPRLSKLEGAGRKLFVVADACFSGASIRNPQLRKPLTERYLPMSARNLYVSKPGSSVSQTIEPYPYQSTVYISAAAEGERAADISQADLSYIPTFDGLPHGAMTDSLLRVLRGEIDADSNRDGQLDFREIHTAVATFMASRTYSHTPQLLPSVAEDVGNITLSSLNPLRSGQRPHLPASAIAERLRVTGINLPMALRQELQQTPNIEWVDGTTFDLKIIKLGDALQLLTAAEDLIQTLPSTNSQSLKKRLSQLSWAYQLKRTAESGRKGILSFDINPAALGGNFVDGQLLNLAVRPNRPSILAVIDVDSDGFITVLYPTKATETRPLSSDRVYFIPGDHKDDLIKAGPPYGTDFLFAFAFDTPPQY